MKFILLPAFALLSISTFFAQTPAGGDPVKVLEELDLLVQKRTQHKVGQRSSSINQVLDAAKSPVSASAAYADAHRTIELVGKVGQSAEFEAWRKKNEALLGSSEFRATVQNVLRYLALTLQRSGSDDPAAFIQPSIDYLKEFAEMQPRIASGEFGTAKERLALEKEPVDTGIFAKAWRLAVLFQKLSNWEMVPGNTEGILEKNIRSIYRKDKSPFLLETWDWQIQLEESRLKNIRRQHEIENFAAVRKPRLLFMRAKDLAVLDQKYAASNEVLQLLRTYPEHPDFDIWVAQIREWIPNSPAAAPPANSKQSEPAVSKENLDQ